MTPFGMASGSVGGTGSVSVGPMGVSTSLAGPIPISAANTVNRLGVASPFAQPFGQFNPVQPNSFGAVNPFDPNWNTPYDGFNGAPFGSFGPFQNPLSPLSWQQGGSFDMSFLNPVSMNQGIAGFGAPSPQPFGGGNFMSFLQGGGGSFLMNQVPQSPFQGLF